MGFFETDEEREAFYTNAWNAVPAEMKAKCKTALQNVIAVEDAEKIAAKHAQYGHDWIHRLIDTPQAEIDELNAMLPEGTDLEEHGWPAEQSAHHGFGTAIRNLLRKEVATDDELPGVHYPGHVGEFDGLVRNWDDYYVSAIEHALGLR